MKKNKILENLIYLAVFFIPLYLVRIRIGNFPTNALEIMILGIFFLWIFTDKEKIKVREFFIKYKRYVIFGTMMFLGILLSTFFSGNQLQSWGIIKSWFLVPLILFFLTWNIIEKEKINQIFLVYSFSAFFVALISCGYYIANFLTYDNRLAGIFNSPNYLAMYLAPAIIILIFQKNKLKIGYFLFSIPILVALFFTYSYSAWFSVVASLIVLVLIKNKNIFKKIAIIIIIILALFLSQLNSKKLTDLLSANPRSSLASRRMIWQASGKMIENNFIFGIGPGNFQRTYLEYQKFYPPYLEWAVPHPNNSYLTWWLYGGMLGAVGFLGVVFLFLRDVSIRSKKEPRQVLFVALGIMLVILIHGIFDTTYFKNDLAIIFWLNFLVLK
ncbi:MAG: O-antigen ligase family protein [bacterium]|nr:O-antigen ligase family protein [bacterium]